MDEACSSVDNQTEQRILKNLTTGVQDKTIIWVTHHEAVKHYMSNCLDMNTLLSVSNE
jgi:ABC-type transport system involved in cytochrome bd biosynthesis fused ATPase/permease subunit